jgi:hypothetical protein
MVDAHSWRRIECVAGVLLLTLLPVRKSAARALIIIGPLRHHSSFLEMGEEWRQGAKCEMDIVVK